MSTYLMLAVGIGAPITLVAIAIWQRRYLIRDWRNSNVESLIKMLEFLRQEDSEDELLLKLLERFIDDGIYDITSKYNKDKLKKEKRKPRKGKI